MRGSLGIRREAEHGYDGMPGGGHWKLGQEECGSLFQIVNSFLDCFTLCGGARFRIQRDVSTFFCGGKYGGQFHVKFSEKDG